MEKADDIEENDQDWCWFSPFSFVNWIEEVRKLKSFERKASSLPMQQRKVRWTELMKAFQAGMKAFQAGIWRQLCTSLTRCVPLIGGSLFFVDGKVWNVQDDAASGTSSSIAVCSLLTQSYQVPTKEIKKLLLSEDEGKIMEKLLTELMDQGYLYPVRGGLT